MEEKDKLWIARDKNERLYIYKKIKPYKSEVSAQWRYSGEGDNRYHGRLLEADGADLFPEVQWKDEEPKEIYTTRAEAIRTIARDIKTVTEDEQEAIFELIDALKGQI